MRRQIVAACLLQYIFVGEDGSEERGGRRTTSFQSELCSARTFLLGAPSFSRDYRSDGRGSGNTIPRPQERRHFHNIQMYKSAGPEPLENEKGRGSAHRRREIRRHDEKDRGRQEEEREAGERRVGRKKGRERERLREGKGRNE